jgi:predicted ribosome quality control (RQC) complex YloA/Tae2 family protein
LGKKTGNKGRKKRKDVAPYPTVQSDQNRDAYLEAEAPREQMKTTQELLEEYSEELIDTKSKGPRRPTG